jgi:hypothetical protein
MERTNPTTSPLPVGRDQGIKRWLKRGPWELAAVIIIALGVVMLMQPLSLTLYSYSFVTTLVGTGLFIIVSKFPE